MAAPKAIKDKTGNTPKSGEIASDNPQRPLNLFTLAAAVVQLQNSLNELVVKYNAHVHTENTNATYAQNATTGVPQAAGLVSGTAQTAANLFTAS